MSFFKSIWKSDSKHKKLCEELALANSLQDFPENCESDEVVTYIVKYIGNIPVNSSRSEKTTSAAVKKIISKRNKKLQQITLSISPKGIEMSDFTTGESLLQVSIYQISYCSADASNSQVFAFIESNTKLVHKTSTVNEEQLTFSNTEDSETTYVCHAFLTQKKKMAQTVTLSVGRSFERAYQVWQKEQRLKCKNQKNQLALCTTNKNTENIENNKILIDLNTDLEPLNLKVNKNYLQNTWISFEDDIFEEFHQTASI